MTDPNIWNQFLIWPIMNILVFFYRVLESFRIPGALGFAVILMTVAIRLVLYPLMHAQLKSARKMSKLKPHMDALSKKHKGDKAALQKAQLDLYREHGVNPAAGCLPLLIQMPVLIALYNVFYQVLGNGNLQKVITDINAIVYHPFLKLSTLDLTFFGVNLGVKPSEWQSAGVWLLSIPLITAGLQWYQTKLMMPAAVPDGKPDTVSHKQQKPNTSKKDKENPEKSSDVDQAAEMQKQMAIISPLMFGFFAFQFPLGLALYWNVFGLFGIMQQLAVNRQIEA
jgi:YidC/Oxa1 family membrane protein insertase